MLNQCFCVGPQNGQPKCPCAMRSVDVRDGRYIQREVDLGPAPDSRWSVNGVRELTERVLKMQELSDSKEIQGEMTNNQKNLTLREIHEFAEEFSKSIKAHNEEQSRKEMDEAICAEERKGWSRDV